MQVFVIVVHLLIVLAMIGFVLLQKSEGGGLGVGSGGGGFLSSRGTSNVLSRTTAILAGAFFATSLFLSVLAGLHKAPTSILSPAASSGPQVPASGNAPTAPQGGSGGLLDQLRQQEEPPRGPQVPQSQQ